MNIIMEACRAGGVHPLGFQPRLRGVSGFVEAGRPWMPRQLPGPSCSQHVSEVWKLLLVLFCNMVQICTCTRRSPRRTTGTPCFHAGAIVHPSLQSLVHGRSPLG